MPTNPVTIRTSADVAREQSEQQDVRSEGGCGCGSCCC